MMHQKLNPEEEDSNVRKIGAKVLKRLGKPVRLFKVEVIHLWDKNYRINVWCCEERAGGVARNYCITDSFFGKLSESGVLKTNPKIEKKY
tara:strand:- start:223 stop:492 length:270 start_codon:yes stop_codon:yes gene_type:complete